MEDVNGAETMALRYTIKEADCKALRESLPQGKGTGGTSKIPEGISDLEIYA